MHDVWLYEKWDFASCSVFFVDFLCFSRYCYSMLGLILISTLTIAPSCSRQSRSDEPHWGGRSWCHDRHWKLSTASHDWTRVSVLFLADAAVKWSALCGGLQIPRCFWAHGHHRDTQKEATEGWFQVPQKVYKISRSDLSFMTKRSESELF